VIYSGATPFYNVGGRPGPACSVRALQGQERRYCSTQGAARRRYRAPYHDPQLRTKRFASNVPHDSREIEG
jgi:hypothetical protein